MFYENFKKICDIHNTTPTQVTEKLGMSKGSVSNWKKGTTPNGDIVVRFAEHFNVSTDYLLTGKEYKIDLPPNELELLDSFRLLQTKEKYKVLGRIETYLEEYEYASDESDNKEYYIKEETQKNNITYLDRHREFQYETELWGEVSAGSGIDAIANRETIKVPFKCDFALRIVGNSMEPLYYDQQIIYLKQQPDIEQGQIAAVQIDDYIPIAYLKKIYKENSHIRLVSLNPLYEDMIFLAAQVRILGIVIDT